MKNYLKSRKIMKILKTDKSYKFYLKSNVDKKKKSLKIFKNSFNFFFKNLENLMKNLK